MEKVKHAAKDWEQAVKAERQARAELAACVRDERKAGSTLSAIAEVLGVTRARVHQMSKEEK